MQTVNIFLDDIREPAQAYNYTKNPAYLKKEWKVVRNYDEFVRALVNIQLDGNALGSVSLDHDLCVEHMEVPCEVFAEYTADQLGMELTGLDCAKYLTEHLDTYKLPIPGMTCHSQNPVGKERINQHLMDWMDGHGGDEEVE